MLCVVGREGSGIILMRRGSTGANYLGSCMISDEKSIME